MSSDAQRRHEVWLGMVQPVEGLVFSAPVLADGNVPRPDLTPSELQRLFLRACPPSQTDEQGNATRPAITDPLRFFELLLEYRPTDWHRAQGEGETPGLPAELRLDVPEADQVLVPTLALPKRTAVTIPEGTDATEAARAGAPYELLVWDLADAAVGGDAAIGLDLDKPEEVTGGWRYPPTAKFERLLRHVRVPIGLLTNRRELRLVYAPHGESTGHLTFRFDDLAEVGGRPILDAMVALLHAERHFSLPADETLGALLRQSRERQANVTTQLAEQVMDALQILLRGFQAAAERDPDGYGRVFATALERRMVRHHQLTDATTEGDHVYRGLLTVMLRLVFLLFAEDRALLPVDKALYRDHFSVLALFARLQEDAGAHPDSMGLRFGAWGQLLAVFRAVFTGVDHADLHMPARHGDLFDPHRFPFLEGVVAGASPLGRPEQQAGVNVPTLDDGTVFRVLEKLIVFEGQRLSYKALDVEQIGSVYEALMGFHVERMPAPAVRVRVAKGSPPWLTVEEVLEHKPAQRAKWLKKEVGLSTANAKKLTARLTEVAKLSSADLKAQVEELGYGGEPRAAVEDDERADEVRRHVLMLDALTQLAAVRKKSQRDKALAAAGQLVLQPGEERRRTSSHYTPRSLSAPIVERTLEPLLRAMGDAPTADQLLELKICDPAMGSGAFLVAACDYLGNQLVAAWTREGTLAQVAKDAPGEDPVLYARRLVAQRCLYGVDKNDAAVELAKLSLWLFTLARDRPFTFLDHALRHGDSLVGLSFEQIRNFTWEPESQLKGLDKAGAQLDLSHQELDAALGEAIPIRQRILELAKDPSPEAQREKEQLVFQAADALDRVRLIGDVIVGAFFAEKKKKAREKEKERRRALVQQWLAGDEEAGQELRQLQAEIRARLPVFHWMLEYPEVFWSERADPLAMWATDGEAYMDAFVGNPPFMGGSGISTAMGDEFRDWLLEAHAQSHGNADLCVHFFRAAHRLLGAHGTVGLIATNTIAQGDTRSTGLQWLCRQGATIYAATPTRTWPGEAAVMVAEVHLSFGSTCPARRVLSGRPVPEINSRLRAGGERDDASPLGACAGVSFIGSKVYGQGFVLSTEERCDLIENDAANGECIFPYIGGQEVNASPTHSHDRYVINFGQMSLEEAEKWPDLISIVRERVKPERERNKREVRRRYWWRFGEVAPALYAAVSSLQRCLVVSRHTKHLCFAWQPIDRVFSEALQVWAIEVAASFATLQSRVHEGWARLLSSSMKNDLRYAASDCFETFPFPEPDPRTVLPTLETIGEALYEARAKYMVDTQQGLTTTYNLLKDPAEQDPRLLELRDLHVAMDRAVLEAYAKSTAPIADAELVDGQDPRWTNIQVPPFCPDALGEEAEAEWKQAVARFQDQTIDLLFQLNASRARAENGAQTATSKGR